MGVGGRSSWIEPRLSSSTSHLRPPTSHLNQGNEDVLPSDTYNIPEYKGIFMFLLYFFSHSPFCIFPCMAGILLLQSARG